MFSWLCDERSTKGREEETWTREGEEDACLGEEMNGKGMEITCLAPSVSG